MDFIKFSEKQIPLTIYDSILHLNNIRLIKNIEVLQNTIFYGHEGKTVLINLLLKKIFKKITIRPYIFALSSKVIKCRHSDYHLEIDIKNIIKNEGILLDLIKDYTSTLSIINSVYKVVIIYNFDLLNNRFQVKFRTIMEKLYNCSRFIFHTSSISKVIEPIKSRCISIRVSTISQVEGIEFVKSILKITKLKMNKPNMIKILEDASFMRIISIKKLLYILFIKLQSSKHKVRYNIDFHCNIKILYKELCIKRPLTSKVQILHCIILKLLEQNNSPQFIMQYLLNHLIENEKITDEKKINIIHKTTYHENLINKGRVIVNLEAYIVYLLLELGR
jgi:DNA polymerase III delta prime subunit